MSETVTVLCGFCGESTEIPTGEESICPACAEKRDQVRKNTPEPV